MSLGVVRTLLQKAYREKIMQITAACHGNAQEIVQAMGFLGFLGKKKKNQPTHLRM